MCEFDENEKLWHTLISLRLARQNFARSRTYSKRTEHHVKVKFARNSAEKGLREGFTMLNRRTYVKDASAVATLEMVLLTGVSSATEGWFVGSVVAILKRGGDWSTPFVGWHFHSFTFCPSHFQELGMHRPLDLHWN